MELYRCTGRREPQLHDVRALDDVSTLIPCLRIAPTNCESQSQHHPLLNSILHHLARSSSLRAAASATRDTVSPIHPSTPRASHRSRNRKVKSDRDGRRELRARAYRCKSNRIRTQSRAKGDYLLPTSLGFDRHFYLQTTSRFVPHSLSNSPGNYADTFCAMRLGIPEPRFGRMPKVNRYIDEDGVKPPKYNLEG